MQTLMNLAEAFGSNPHFGASALSYQVTAFNAAASWDKGPTAPGSAIEANLGLLLGWLKWGALVAAVVGLIICALMMILGRRGRSQTAVEGAMGIPWILGGLTLIASAGFIVTTFLGSYQ